MKKVNAFLANYGLIWEQSWFNEHQYKMLVKEKKKIERGNGDKTKLLEIFMGIGDIKIVNPNQLLKYIEREEMGIYLKNGLIVQLHTRLYEGELKPSFEVNTSRTGISSPKPGARGRTKGEIERFYRAVMPEIETIKEPVQKNAVRIRNTAKRFTNPGLFTDYQIRMVRKKINENLVEIGKEIKTKVYTNQFKTRLIALIIEDLNQQKKDKKMKMVRSAMEWMEPFIESAKR